MEDVQMAIFIPMLVIPKGTFDLIFYQKAFDAKELRRWNNEDGSIHVAELSINGAMFHLHEEDISKGNLSPALCKGVTTTVGLMVKDVDAVMARSIAAGAQLIDKVKDYDYGYRQGKIADAFGHHWLIEQVI